MIRSDRPNRVRGSRRLCQRRSSAELRACATEPPASRVAEPGASIGLEDIADAPHRLQIAREFGISLDLAAEPRHLHVDGAHVAAELRLLGEPLTPTMAVAGALILAGVALSQQRATKK